jgi:hypothetical protein
MWEVCWELGRREPGPYRYMAESFITLDCHHEFNLYLIAI